MAEYIKREAAIKAITSYFEPVNTVDEAVHLNYLLKKLMLPPAADVVEVRHGRWIDNIDDNGVRRNAWRECSVCGGLNFSKRPPYCPNCGADMRERRAE